MRQSLVFIGEEPKYGGIKIVEPPKSLSYWESLKRGTKPVLRPRAYNDPITEGDPYGVKAIRQRVYVRFTEISLIC